jgi:hypothetical protein
MIHQCVLTASAAIFPDRKKQRKRTLRQVTHHARFKHAAQRRWDRLGEQQLNATGGRRNVLGRGAATPTPSAMRAQRPRAKRT